MFFYLFQVNINKRYGKHSDETKSKEAIAYVILIYLNKYTKKKEEKKKFYDKKKITVDLFITYCRHEWNLIK